MNSSTTDREAYEQDNIAEFRRKQMDYFYPRGRYSVRGFLRWIVWLFRH